MKFLNFHHVLKVSVILLFGLVFPVSASVIEIKSLSDVVEHVQRGDPNGTVLCGFDIDFTLTRPVDPATDPANFQRHAKTFMQTLGQHKLNPQDVICATALTEQQLMESDTPALVDAIHSHATVVGLTARYSGQFAGIDFEDHTLEMLAQFGIKFNGAIGKRTVFEDLPEHRGNKPVINKGVIFCNGERGAPVTKPQVLAEYLKSYAPHTTRVVIVDDTKKHLDDFVAFFADTMPTVEFVGLHYTKAMSDAPRECDEDDFKKYVQCLINMLQ